MLLNAVLTGIAITFINGIITAVVIRGFVDKKIQSVENRHKKRRENIQRQFVLDRKTMEILFTVLKRINYGIQQHQKNDIIYWDEEYQKSIDALFEIEKELRDFDTEMLQELHSERGH